MKYRITKILSCAVIFVVMIFLGKNPAINRSKGYDDSDVTETLSTDIYTTNIPVVTDNVISESIIEEENYILTKDEIDLIALVTMAEAESECEYGKRLVIDTILNRVDDKHFPGTVYDVIYQPNQFTSMWNGRINKCCVRDDIVDLVKQELKNRSNTDVVFFMAGGYSKYGKPLFQVEHHYFSSYN